MSTLDDISELLEAKAQALVERSAGDLAALIHTGFVYVNAGGRTFDKGRYVDTYCRSGRVVFTRQRITGLAVRLVDRVAVATFLVDDTFRVDGREVSARYQSLCVFSDASGPWLWVAGQTMPSAVV